MSDFADPDDFADFIEAIRSARHGVQLYAKRYGPPALVILANAIDEFCSWHSEVLLWKHDLENHAMEEHAVFIPSIMDKARTTQAYWQLTDDILQRTSDAVPEIVKEILAKDGQEL